MSDMYQYPTDVHSGDAESRVFKLDVALCARIERLEKRIKRLERLLAAQETRVNRSRRSKP